jgi:hypothetical protein
MVDGLAGSVEADLSQIRRTAPRRGPSSQIYERLSPFQNAGGNSGRQPCRFTQYDKEITMVSHRYTGLWVTEDGHVRHALLPNGRYVEARGNREGAYQGRYEINGDHIAYKDDTGFTADGEFRKDVLYHAGMVLMRD